MRRKEVGKKGKVGRRRKHGARKSWGRIKSKRRRRQMKAWDVEGGGEDRTEKIVKDREERKEGGNRTKRT